MAPKLNNNGSQRYPQLHQNYYIDNHNRSAAQTVPNAPPNIHAISERAFNTNSPTRMAISLGAIILCPILVTAKLCKSNKVIDILSKLASAWGLLYVENGLIDGAIQKQSKGSRV